MLGPCRKCGSAERNKWGQCPICKSAWYRTHKADVAASSTAWATANPDAREETLERSRLKKYGLTPEQYQALLEKQGGRCALCNEPFGRRVYIDHDHVTGVVRGLLHLKCNVGLGHFQDNPALLRAAAEYLENHTLTDLVVVAPRPVYRPGDGRYKVTDEMRVEIRRLREQGLSLGSIAKKVGLSRSWVQIVLKFEGGGSSITTS